MEDVLEDSSERTGCNASLETREEGIMQEIKIEAETDQMINFIKDLLCLEHGELWKRRTVGDSITLRSNADRGTVRLAIYEFLEERKIALHHVKI